MRSFLPLVAVALAFSACAPPPQQRRSEQLTVAQQQKRYEIAQPVPVFDASTERDIVTKLYRIRNEEVTTHSVWRSSMGVVEGDCPSYGYGIPYDTSLTNPLKTSWRDGYQSIASAVTEQAEPNGLYSSKNTNATWVLCLGDSGALEPVYTESLLTVYPTPVKIDYRTNRVVPYGKANVFIAKPNTQPIKAEVEAEVEVEAETRSHE